MSSAQEEADDGPIHDDSEEESQNDNQVLDIAELPSHGRKDLVPGSHEAKNEVKVEKDEESVTANSDHTPLKNGTHLSDQRISIPLVSRDSTPEIGRPSSADGSLSIPDDTPSVQVSKTHTISYLSSFILSQGSLASSPARRAPSSTYGRSPTPSLRPFDRRFQARLSASPVQSPRASSPAFLNVHSRQSSAAFTIQDFGGTDSPQAPWDVVRWTKLRRITGQAFSEVGKRNFGRPTCIAVSASIALGTSKGIILVFDYNQNLKSIIGPGTKGRSLLQMSRVGASTDSRGYSD